MRNPGSFAGACGIDEAGRGPLAGPVCAACVYLPDDFPVGLLGDSKRLSEKAREKAFDRITALARWGIGWASHEEIDELNILQATMLAMRRAYESMLACANGPEPPARAIVDGNRAPALPVPCATEVRGDATYYEIMAASILAKVSRDRVMREYAAMYPEYGYDRHSGYPTEAHRRVLRELGPSPIQRKTFSYR